MNRLDRDTLAKMIDHTLLKPHAGEAEIARLCAEARAYAFGAVCVNSSFVRLAADALRGSGVAVCSVVGFPLGACTTAAKAFEAREAVGNGAGEIDMVIHVGALRDKRLDFVRDDIGAVVAASRPALVKVILETCFLSDEEIAAGCELAVQAGAKFVKTSTGFGGAGASAGHVRLMRRTVGADFGVKASGGIRTLQDVRAMLEAGASRLGLSAGVAVIEELARASDRGGGG